jgi:hypothetical protein
MTCSDRVNKATVNLKKPIFLQHFCIGATFLFLDQNRHFLKLVVNR